MNIFAQLVSSNSKRSRRKGPSFTEDAAGSMVPCHLEGFTTKVTNSWPELNDYLGILYKSNILAFWCIQNLY